MGNNWTINTRGARIVFKTKAISAFLADANKYKPLDPEEEVNLIIAYQNGDESAGEKVVCANLGFAYSLASKLQKDGNILDLVDCAVIGMMTAMASFDATKGIKFLSYAVFYMRFEIQRYYIEQSHLIKIPKTILHFGEKNSAIREKFLQENEYEPTDEIVMDILENEYKISVPESSDLSPKRYTSFDKQILEDSNGDASEYGNIALRTSNEIEYDTTQEDNKLLVDYFMKNLNHREKIICQLYFFENKTYDEIGEILGISGNGARIILLNGIDRLKNKMKRYRKAI